MSDLLMLYPVGLQLTKYLSHRRQVFLPETYVLRGGKREKGGIGGVLLKKPTRFRRAGGKNVQMGKIGCTEKKQGHFLCQGTHHETTCKQKAQDLDWSRGWGADPELKRLQFQSNQGERTSFEGDKSQNKLQSHESNSREQGGVGRSHISLTLRQPI